MIRLNYCCNFRPMLRTTKKMRPRIHRRKLRNSMPRRKKQVIRLAHLNPRGTSRIACNVHRSLNILLRHKLFIAGKRYDAKNDEAIVAGQHPVYRITEEASNKAELKCARSAEKLLCQPSEWQCMHLDDYTLTCRAKAFRMIVRQQALVFLLLYLPHLVGPFTLFKDLNGNSDSFDTAIGQLECFRDDFMHHHMSAYPSVAALLSGISIFLLRCIADMARTQSTRSENGHAFWQREARLKGIQTICADFEDVNAIVFYTRPDF